MNQNADHQIAHLLNAIYPSTVARDGDRVPQGFTNATALSDHLQSDLTCNASSSRKRNRDEAVINVEAPVYQQLCILNSATSPQIKPAVPVVFARGFPLSTGTTFPVFDSTASCTTDQPAGVFTPFTASLSPDLTHLFHQQDNEIRTLLRHQIEMLRLGMEEKQKKYCRTLLSTLGLHAMKKIREKETELENATRKNADLEEKARQMTAEGLIWFNLAKNNEALVSSLKTSLEQAMIQNVAATAVLPAIEGFGDTDSSPFLADDAQSTCFDQNQFLAPPVEVTVTGAPASGGRRCQMACRICRENEVSVLVLPCKHLCLCKVCDAGVQICPVCRFHKNASLQIFMS